VSDFISKVVNLCILFTMILAVMGMVFASQQATSQRLVLNEATEFLDKVSDKAYLTAGDMDELYMRMNSHGMLLDVEVERLMYAPMEKDDAVISNYTSVDSTETLGVEKNGQKKSEIAFNKNDLVRIKVKEIGMPGTRRFIYRLIGIDTGAFEFALAAPVQ
jgi:hypothetical protein